MFLKDTDNILLIFEYLMQEVWFKHNKSNKYLMNFFKKKKNTSDLLLKLLLPYYCSFALVKLSPFFVYFSYLSVPDKLHSVPFIDLSGQQNQVFYCKVPLNLSILGNIVHLVTWWVCWCHRWASTGWLPEENLLWW